MKDKFPIDISSKLFSFREKLSFVTNSDQYPKRAYKAWTIFKLIISFGKCNLPTITYELSWQVANGEKKSDCIFSRKVRALLNSKIIDDMQAQITNNPNKELSKELHNEVLSQFDPLYTTTNVKDNDEEAIEKDVPDICE